jgi:hypothetical protein
MGNKIVKILANKSITDWQTPQIFNTSDAKDSGKLEQLIAQGLVNHVSDQIDEALEELYHIQYPAQIDSLDKQQLADYVTSLCGDNTDKYGNWVYYAWNKTLVHFPTKDDLRKLRGSRNRNLITEEERQVLISNKTILILGLSVGSNVVDSLLMQGIGSRYILVDMDSLGPTNLNRIRASYDQIGVHKVDVVAKKISELDPFIDQVHYKDGLNEDNLTEILQTYKPDIIVDEMDSLKMKLVIRQRAKEQGIPVLMATDDGDDILLDIERFDLDKSLPILHGAVPDEVIEAVLQNKKMTRNEMGAIIGNYFVGMHNVPVRMIESLMEVGKTLPSWPQLGAAAVLSGIYVSYAAKKILLGLPLNSGRFLMGPESQLNPHIQTEKYIQKKAHLIKLMQQGPKPH